GPLGGQAPVAVHVAAAPAGAGAAGVGAVGVRLVVQVGADHGRVARVVPVQQDAHALAARVVDDLVQDLQRGEALQVGVGVPVDAVGLRAGLEGVVGVGHPDRVVPEARHLVDVVAPGPGPQPVERLVVGLHAEPVEAGQPHLGAAGV